MPSLTVKAPRKTQRKLDSATSVARAWDKEIRARIKAVDSGKTVGLSYSQLKKEMETRFGR